MLANIGISTVLGLMVAGAAMAQAPTMSFFVTSVNPGKGADLGGLDGADAYCASLAEAAGVTGKVWAAYLSATGVNARDRIGTGPWYNARGEKIADDVASLHGDASTLTKQTALDEKGNVINGRGDEPNRHDILTGSNADGTAAAQTCEDWTASGEGAAMVGHSDRMGLPDAPTGPSWNAAHPTRGCGMEALRATGGDGLFYCFAVD